MGWPDRRHHPRPSRTLHACRATACSHAARDGVPICVEGARVQPSPMLIQLRLTETAFGKEVERVPVDGVRELALILAGLRRSA